MTSLVNLKGKKGIILELRMIESIAWGIAEKLSKCGAELAFSYVNDSIKKRVIPLAEKCGSNIVIECDVTSDSSVDNFFKKLIHTGNLLTSRSFSCFFRQESIKRGLCKYIKRKFYQYSDVSCYSFTSLCQRAQNFMLNGGQILTLSYLGAERVMPHYNVMGIAKAALKQV